MPYIGAPYNFVPFADRVYNPVSKEHMEDHDKIYKVENVSPDANGEERYAGEITYTITAESPIMIGDGKKHGDDKTEYFFKNENGKFAIPGSTMRGLIRGNVQILGASSVRRDIDDYRLMYRHVANGALKDEYGERLGNGTVSHTIPGQKKEVSISVLKKVKAGYIKCKDDGTYEIIPTRIDSIDDHDMPNYYVLSERKIAYEWEKYAAGQAGETFAYDLFVKEAVRDGHPVCLNTILMHRPDSPFRMSIKTRRKGRAEGDSVSEREIWYDPNTDDSNVYTLSHNPVNGYQTGRLVTWKKDGRMITQLKDSATGKSLCVGDIHYKGRENSRYAPYVEKCSYKVSKTDRKDIVAVSASEKPSSEGWEQGWAVSTGRMKEKKAIYIIPEKDPKIKFALDPQDIKSFQIDYNKRENALKSLFDKVAEGSTKEEKNEDKKTKARKCFGLPQPGKEKPVFYIGLDGAASTYYISFTPHLRLFYDYSVAKGIHEGPLSSNGYDLATSIFGISEDNKYFKSKVSFADAELTLPDDQQNTLVGKQQNVILAEPKPSSYLDYLEQSQLSTYSSDSFKLRGIKQYWMREDIYCGNANNNNDNFGSKFIPLKKGARFIGKIRFQNLTGEELGLLLWSIRLEPGCKMNVGKGKPYGFGVISISDIKTKILNTEKAYNTDELTLDPLTEISEEKQTELIDEYKKTVVGGKKVVEMASVKTFLRMKNEMPDPERIQYMSIDNEDYKSRKRRLHTVKEVLDEKPGFEPPEVEAVRSKTGENRDGGNRGRDNCGGGNYSGGNRGGGNYGGGNHGGGNHAGAVQAPALRPIERGSYIRVIIDALEPDNKNRGKLKALFTDWHRIEPGQEKEMHKVKEGGVYKVSGDKKVGDEIRIRVTKVEKEAGTETIIKGEQD